MSCHASHNSSQAQILSQTEEFSFFDYTSNMHPVILGYPWLRLHNPQINWTSGTITSLAVQCKSCFLEVSKTITVVSSSLVLESPELPNVPQCYCDLKEVFSKVRAICLLPHPPNDCSIDLLPSTTPPKDFYSLSAPEMMVIKEYIQNSLMPRIILPSSFPTAARFFFVEKKDKSLQHCINDRGLN